MFNYSELPYYKEICALKEALESTNVNLNIKRKDYNKFVYKFTLPPIIWIRWLYRECYPSTMGTEEKLIFSQKLRKIALSQFYDAEFLEETSIHPFLGHIGFSLPDENRKFTKVLTCPYFERDCYEREIKNKKIYLKILENLLSFPHRRLEDVFDIYKENSDSLITPNLRKMYLNNKKIYDSLMTAFYDKSSQKWFDILIQIRDKDVIIQNVEYFIAEIPTEKMAWKLYIDFLKNKYPEAMLNLYSRYCHFFVNDFEMRKRYHQEIIGFHNQGNNVLKWLFDLIEIEQQPQIFEKSHKNITKICDQYLNNIENNNYTKKLVELILKKQEYQRKFNFLEEINISDVWFMKDEYALFDTFDSSFFADKTPSRVKSDFFEEKQPIRNMYVKVNFHNYLPQRFSFCKSLIQYFLKDSYGRQKLYQTCKYFYALRKIPVCYGLRIDDESNKNSYSKSSLILSTKYFNTIMDQIKNTPAFIPQILKKLTINTTLFISNPTNPKCFSQLRGFKILEIKYLTLKYQEINFKDIDLINEACKQLISIFFKDVKIFTNDGSAEMVQDVVKRFHKVKKITLLCKDLVFTEDTTECLANLPPKTRFREFILYFVSIKMNSEHFCTFLKKFAEPGCIFEISYHENIRESLNEFRYGVYRLCADWEPNFDAPKPVLAYY